MSTKKVVVANIFISAGIKNLENNINYSYCNNLLWHLTFVTQKSKTKTTTTKHWLYRGNTINDTPVIFIVVHKIKNPKWLKANNLAIYKCD